VWREQKQLWEACLHWPAVTVTVEGHAAALLLQGEATQRQLEDTRISFWALHIKCATINEAAGIYLRRLYGVVQQEMLGIADGSRRSKAVVAPLCLFVPH